MWSRVRRNHALEHATVHLLARQQPNLKVVGRSTPGGFYLYGPDDTYAVERAAQQAVLALAADRDLAVHPRCGTNLAVTGILAGLAAFFASGGRSRGRLMSLPRILLATLWGVLLAQPLGNLAQRYVTTDANVARAHVGPVRREAGRPGTHFVPVHWE